MASPIVQMVQDPDFSRLSPIEQRKALAAHDPIFSGADNGAIAQFVQAHRVDATRGKIGDFQKQSREPVAAASTKGGFSVADHPLLSALWGAAKQTGRAIADPGMSGSSPSRSPEELAAGDQFREQLKTQGKSPWNPLNYLDEGNAGGNMAATALQDAKSLNPIAPAFNNPNRAEGVGESVVNVVQLANLLRGGSGYAPSGNVPRLLGREVTGRVPILGRVEGFRKPTINEYVAALRPKPTQASAPAVDVNPVAARANALMRARNPELFGEASNRGAPAAKRAARVEEILKAAKGAAPAAQPAAAAAPTVDAAELVSAGRNLGLRPEEAQARAREAISQFPNDQDAAIQYMAGRKAPVTAQPAAPVDFLKTPQGAEMAARVRKFMDETAQAGEPAPQRTNPATFGGSTLSPSARTARPVSGGSSPAAAAGPGALAQLVARARQMQLAGEGMPLKKAGTAEEQAWTDAMANFGSPERGTQVAETSPQAGVPVPQIQKPAAAQKPGAVQPIKIPVNSAEELAQVKQLVDTLRQELALQNARRAGQGGPSGLGGQVDVTASQPGSNLAEVNRPARSYVAKNQATMQRMEDAAKAREALAARGIKEPTGSTASAGGASADIQQQLVQELQKTRGWGGARPGAGRPKKK